MAATAVLKLAPNATAVANSRNEENVNSTPNRRLSFAASNVAGENFTSSPQFRLQRRRYGDHSERRNPVIVSPKAVSDSQNSQTCLDPDASRSVLGIILGGGAGTRLYPLTKKRAKPVVPLGANYRARAFPQDRSHLRLRFLLQSCRLIHPHHQICRACFLRHLLQFPGPAQSIVTVVDGHGICYQIVDGVMTE